MSRTATASLEAEVEPTQVMALMVDAVRIPEWAPGFADAVRAEPDGALVAVRDGRRFPLRVAVGFRAGSVDVLREVAPGSEGGAHVHVAPPPGGRVVTMTIPIGADGDPTVAEATVRAELAALVQVLAVGIG